MNQVVTDLWPMVATALLTGIGTYIGFIHKLRIKVGVQDTELRHIKEDVARLDKRLEKKANQFDAIQNDLADIKSDIAALAAELKTSLEILKKNV